MTTLTTDQQKLMEIISQATAALAALCSAAPAKKGRKPKSQPSDETKKEKKPLGPKIVAMNEERKAIFQEMKSVWYSANPSAVGLDDKERRAQIKKGELEPMPTYPQALKEHSRRMSEADPEHAKKALKRREALDAKQSETKKEKKVFKVKAPVPSWKISTKFETEDEEEFNMDLEIDGQKYLLNGENWVIDSEHSWVGLWDPESKKVDRTAAEPEA